MLQRIQTLFLLGALALLLLMSFLPLFYLWGEVKVYCYQMRPLFILAVLSMLALTATLFLYKARMIQIRISIYNTVILLGLQGWIGYYLFFDRVTGLTFSITAVCPIVAAVLTVLAIRYIGRDEAMVRSINRLRR